MTRTKEGREPRQQQEEAGSLNSIKRRPEALIEMGGSRDLDKHGRRPDTPGERGRRPGAPLDSNEGMNGC